MSKRLGIFVSVDGPNGVGKTTLIEAVVRILMAEGFSVCLTKEVTDSSLGKFIRDKHREYHGESLALLLAADRSNHVENVIIPALMSHDFVITDRYIDSSLVFQRLDGVALEFLWMLNARFLKPDLSISITASSKTVASRLLSRKSFDRFEETFSRDQEILLFKEAADFLRTKGFNVCVFANDEISLQDAANFLSREIRQLGRQ